LIAAVFVFGVLAGAVVAHRMQTTPTAATTAAAQGQGEQGEKAEPAELAEPDDD
jgi:uncharacterized membrane protein